jgi:hypothetical protein
MYYVFIAFVDAFTATSAITSAITYIEVKETEKSAAAEDDKDDGKEVF